MVEMGRNLGVMTWGFAGSFRATGKRIPKRLGLSYPDKTGKTSPKRMKNLDSSVLLTEFFYFIFGTAPHVDHLHCLRGSWVVPRRGKGGTYDICFWNSYDFVYVDLHILGSRNSIFLAEMY